MYGEIMLNWEYEEDLQGSQSNLWEIGKIYSQFGDKRFEFFNEISMRNFQSIPDHIYKTSPNTKNTHLSTQELNEETFHPTSFSVEEDSIQLDKWTRIKIITIILFASTAITSITSRLTI